MRVRSWQPGTIAGGRGVRLRRSLGRLRAAARRHPQMLACTALILLLLPLVHVMADTTGSPALEIAAETGLVVSLLLGLLLIEDRDAARREAIVEELEANELRFRQIAEQGRHVTYRYRLEPPGFEYLSPAWEPLTGVPVERVLADPGVAAGLLPPEDVARMRAMMRQGTDPGRPAMLRIHRGDGSHRDLEIQSTVVRDADGVATHAVGVVSDVTDRVEAERRLRESEQRFREMADRSQDIIFRYQLRPAHGFSYISQSVVRVGGWLPAAEVVGDPEVLERTVHPEDRFLLASLLTSRQPTKDPVVMRWVAADGTTVWVELTAVPLLGEDGLPDAIDGVARIVTDRVLAEQALARSEERFRLMAERSRDVILRYRVLPTPGLEWASPSIEVLAGVSTAELLEHPERVMAGFEAEDLPALRMAMTEGTQPGQPILVRWHPPGREVATWEVQSVPVRDQAGVVVATESTAHDVTGLVAAIDALERSEARFRATSGLAAIGEDGAVAHAQARDAGRVHELG